MTHEAPSGAQPSLLSGANLPGRIRLRIPLRSRWLGSMRLSGVKWGPSGNNETSKALTEALQRYGKAGAIPCRARTGEHVTGFLDGLKPAGPGHRPGV